MFVKDSNSDLELNYFGARYYHPEIPRFISPDPVGGKPAIPISWNRYLYCRNDPVNRFDPDGRKDYRAKYLNADQIALTEDPNFKQAVRNVIQEMQLDQELGDRQEAGFFSYQADNGDFVIGDVEASGDPRKVHLSCRVTKTGEYVNKNLDSLFASAHGHVGSGKIWNPKDKKHDNLSAWKPSTSDKYLVKKFGVLAFVVIKDEALVVLLPGKSTFRRLLTKDEFLQYISVSQGDSSNQDEGSKETK